MYVISVDVGSGSVRAAIIQFIDGINLNDKPIATSTKSITIYNPKVDHYEQKTDEIWDAVCQCVNDCVRNGQVKCQMVSGIAFSATCSIVIIEENSHENDVIMWMDHRSVSEAKMITESNHPVLQQFGGICSPEFTVPKLVWLKSNQRERFDKSLGFMELPDWLTWRCSDAFANATDKSKSVRDFPRSLCSVVCKWGFDAETHKWRDDLFGIIGLEEFIADKSKIGERIVAPGVRIGYLSAETSKSFGLISKDSDNVQISIACPLIDAHAGVLSMTTFFSSSTDEENTELSYDSLFCMIAGTSTCHMVSTRERQFTKGVWGPYYNAIFPGYYTREAGQSATGKLIEHIIHTYAECQNVKDQTSLENLISEMNKKLLTVNSCEKHNKLHLNPCFHGNRSPLANPMLKGGVYGLTLENNDVIDWYEATIEALAYESKFILQELKMSNLSKVLISGGLSKNALYMQTHADVFNTSVCTFSAGDADLMLVGAAILALAAANNSDLSSTMLKRVKYPNLSVQYYKPRVEVQRYHHLKYMCYRELLESALKIENIMNQL